MQLAFQFCMLIALSTGLVFGLAADTKASKVQTLTDDNFDERTSRGDTPWLINVYAPWYDDLCRSTLLQCSQTGSFAKHTKCAGAGTASSWSRYGAVLRRGCMDG